MPRSQKVIELERASGAERVLEAARGLFATHGYQGTSIRDIVRIAGTNLNSVNYHFGDKQGLYVAVLRREHERADADARRSLPPPDTRADAEVRLRALIERMLFLFLDDASLLPRLAALEIVNPSPAFDEVAPALHARDQQELSDVVRRLLGNSADEELVRRCVRSVLSQCAYYMFTGPVLARMEPGTRFNAAAIHRLADHVAEFSLHAIRGLRRSAT